jgi:hypothetical protein
LFLQEQIKDIVIPKWSIGQALRIGLASANQVIAIFAGHKLSALALHASAWRSLPRVPMTYYI